MKKLLYSCLMILVFALCLPVFTSAEMPEGNSLPPDSLMPGMIEGTGTHFDITDSDYLNIVLESSETITLRMESVPEMVTMHIESASGATSSQITISGFQPLTTYYKYEDDYHNEVAFTTDKNGSYSWTQDLSQPHLVFIQPRASTKFIKDDATGGDCTSIGNWDWSTKTCTLTADVYETIQIDSDYITLDGNGHTVTGTETGSGVYLYGKTGVRIKNLNVEKFFYAMMLSLSNNNSIMNNTISGNTWGIYLDQSHSNTIAGNSIFDNATVFYEGWGIGFYFARNNIVTNNTILNSTQGGGAWIYRSSGNTLRNNAMAGNRYNLFSSVWFDGDFQNDIDTSNTVDGKPIYYLINASNLVLDSASNAGVILCFYCDNITVKDLIITNNFVGIEFYKTNNSTVENVTFTNNYEAILLDRSSNNNILKNKITGNMYGLGVGCTNGDTVLSSNNLIHYNTFLGSRCGVRIEGFLCYDNTVVNNNFIATGARLDYITDGSNNIFNMPSPIGGNYWSNFDTPSEGCYDANNDGFCDAPYYFYYGGVDYLPWVRQSGWEMPADTTPPTITVTATPNILWPPNHKMVDVRIDGSAIDEESGIASVVITVTDEYGIYNMTVPQFGSTIQLEAWREGTDKDGRHYTITVVATDNAGNQSTDRTEVIVPHDMRK